MKPYHVLSVPNMTLARFTHGVLCCCSLCASTGIVKHSSYKKKKICYGFIHLCWRALTFQDMLKRQSSQKLFNSWLGFISVKRCALTGWRAQVGREGWVQGEPSASFSLTDSAWIIRQWQWQCVRALPAKEALLEPGCPGYLQGASHQLPKGQMAALWPRVSSIQQ